MVLKDLIKEDQKNYYETLLKTFIDNKEKTFKVEEVVYALNAKWLIDYIVRSKKYENFSKEEKLTALKDEDFLKKEQEYMLLALNAVLSKDKKAIIELEKIYIDYNENLFDIEEVSFSSNQWFIKSDIKDILGSINIFETLFELNNPITNWALAHNLIDDIKENIFVNINKEFKKQNLTNEELSNKALLLIQKTEDNFLNQLTTIAKYKDIYIGNSKISNFVFYNIELITGSYSDYNKFKEETEKFLKGLCDYKDQFYLIIPRDINQNSFEAAKVLLNKWENIINKTNDGIKATFPELGDKERKNAITKMFKVGFGLNKIQDFAIKKQSDEGFKFNDFILNTVPQYAKKFKMEKSREFDFEETFSVMKNLKIELEFDLIEFKNRFGYSRSDVIKIFDLMPYTKKNNISVFVKNIPQKLNIILLFKNIPHVEDNDEFVNYLSIKTYNKFIKILNFFKEHDILKNADGRYDFLRLNKNEVTFSAELDVINTWIREDKLLENIRLENELSNQHEKEISVKKKI